MLPGDGLAVLESKQVLQKNLHGIRQLGNALETVCLSLGKAEINIVLTVNGKEGTTLENCREIWPRFKTPHNLIANTRVRTPVLASTSGCGYDHFRCPHVKVTPRNIQVRRKMMFTPAASVVDIHIDNFRETCQTIQ